MATRRKKADPGAFRSFRAGTLDLDTLKSLIDTLTPSKFAGNSVQKVASRLLALARNGSLADDQDFRVHEGDLEIAGDLQLRPIRKATTCLCIVQGDLRVGGLLGTGLDPDTVLIVTGNVHAQRLINEGFLQIHGSLQIEHEGLWLGNDGCSEIRGDVHAQLAYTQYHAVKIGGKLTATLALGDDDRFETKKPHPFVEETDDEHKEMLKAKLPRKALEIVGDEDDPEDWCIDAVDAEVLRALVSKGKRVLKS